MDRGLKKVKLVRPEIPDKIWRRFIEVHNSFHVGSGANFMDHMEESMQLESEWEHECSSCTGLNSYNPKYKQYYKEFVVKKSIWVMLLVGGFCRWLEFFS